MTQPSAPIQSIDNPIDEFSCCHEGIVAQLHQLGQLPALLEPANKARHIAAETVKFFNEVVYAHHNEEERDLFPAVLSSAIKGDERDTVQAIVDQLVREHREVEADWEALQPALKAIAKGHEAVLEGDAVQVLVTRYLAHAHFEEKHFLPLSQTILGRNGDHMAALGLSLHIRHALPGVLSRFGGRI
ncbi:MAG: hemerythrin domain-containing protein [Ideonella sp.]|nr:hemerythrin domain-containing protein [Ideonella sp.]MBL0148189.1 hemerythrin domain-containing protein [Ideonella sp.]